MAGQSTDIGRYDFESDGSLPAFRDGRILHIFHSDGISLEAKDKLYMAVR